MSKLKRNLILATVITSAVVILILTIVINHIDSVSDPYLNEQGFDRTTFTGQWPFAVESVIISCEEVEDQSVLSITSPTGARYLLDIDKVSAVEALLAPQLVPQNDIWLDAPVASTDAKSLSNQKVALDDIISAGMTLCQAD